MSGESMLLVTDGIDSFGESVNFSGSSESVLCRIAFGFAGCNRDQGKGLISQQQL
jgi:hypothetical protein